jgi:WD40 repeat protein
MTIFECETYANCVAISPDGNTIVAGHEDGNIFIWKIKVINYDTLDTAPPDISDWLVSNDSSGNVTVQLVASDNTGVARVKIEYVANSESYDRETWLGWQGGEIWSGTLDDTFSNNDQVYLRAWTQDQSPQSNIKTEYYPSNPHIVSTVR